MPNESMISKNAEASMAPILNGELTKLTTLSAEELAQLFPEKESQEELERLLNIVVKSADDNARKAALLSDIDKVSSAVIKIVSKYAKLA